MCVPRIALIWTDWGDFYLLRQELFMWWGATSGLSNFLIFTQPNVTTVALNCHNATQCNEHNPSNRQGKATTSVLCPNKVVFPFATFIHVGHTLATRIWEERQERFFSGSNPWHAKLIGTSKSKQELWWSLILRAGCWHIRPNVRAGRCQQGLPLILPPVPPGTHQVTTDWF